MKPIKILKAVFIVKIVALAAILVVISALSLFVLLFPRNKIETIISLNAENLLQRKVEIGSINYSFRGVKLSNIAILEPESGESFISAESIEITFALAPVFRRKLVLQDLYIDKLSVTIDYKDGVYNLQDMINSAQNAVPDSSTSDPNFTTTLPRLHFTEATIHVKTTPAEISPLVGAYTLSTDITIDPESGVEIKNIDLLLPHKRGHILANLLLEFPENSFLVTGDVNLEDVDIRWTYLFEPENPPKLPYYLVNGRITDLYITPEYTEGRAEGLNCLLINRVFIKIKKGYCKVPYDPVRLIIKDVEASANTSTFLLKDLDVFFDRYVTFDADVHDVNVQDVKAMIPPIENLDLRGNAKGNLAFDGKFFKGTLELTDAALLPYISAVTETVTIQNNIFSKEKINVKILDQDATISIASLSKDFDSFAFNADFDELTLDSEDENTTLPLSENSVSVKGVITAGILQTGETRFTDANFAYSIGKNKIEIPRFKAGFENGNITGKAEITKGKTAPRTHLILNVSRVQVQRLSPYLDNVKDRFYGLVSGNADVSFQLQEDFTNTLQGTLNIKIEDGKVLNTGVQNSLGIILQPLRYKLSDLEFQEIFGNITMDAGGYTINSLMFNSPNIRMSVNGAINRQNIANLDMTLLFNNVFIQDVPNFAYPQFQRYREGEWYIIPFQIENRNIFENPQAELAQ